MATSHITTRRFPGLFLALLLVGACASPRPYWVDSDAKEWSLPLVDPDGGAELLVQAHIGDHGPYLFLVNPDAHYTAIGQSLAEELDLYRGDWHIARSQLDRPVHTRAYELVGLRVGDFRLKTMGVVSFPSGALDVRGHEIRGVLGGNVFTSTIVVDIDRDASVIRATRIGRARIPLDAIAIEGRTYGGQLSIPARINGQSVQLQVDLGHSTSLWPHAADDLGLSRIDVNDTLIDVTGTAEHRTIGANVDQLTIGDIALADQPAVLFWVDGWRKNRVDHGILGRDVLARYRTIIDKNTKTLWLAPRSAKRPGADGAASQKDEYGTFAPRANRSPGS